MKRFCYLLVLSLLAFNGLHAQSSQQQNTATNGAGVVYPVPPANRHMLFYIQRTHNINTIVYELNYNKDSSLNESEPVKVYWIRYADNGEVLPLSSVQKTFAYGVSATLTDKEKKSYKLKLTAYDKREIYLMKTKVNDSYRAYMTINGSLCMLTKIFFKTDGGTFWSPNVVYVELTGKSLSNGKPVVERFKP